MEAPRTANKTMVPAATLAEHSHASSHSSPTWGASIRKIPAATSSISPVSRPVRTAAMTHLMISVCHLSLVDAVPDIHRPSDNCPGAA